MSAISSHTLTLVGEQESQTNQKDKVLDTQKKLEQLQRTLSHSHTGTLRWEGCDGFPPTVFRTGSDHVRAAVPSGCEWFSNLWPLKTKQVDRTKLITLALSHSRTLTL